MHRARVRAGACSCACAKRESWVPRPSSTSSSEILPAVTAVEEFFASARLLADELASVHTRDHLHTETRAHSVGGARLP